MSHYSLIFMACVVSFISSFAPPANATEEGAIRSDFQNTIRVEGIKYPETATGERDYSRPAVRTWANRPRSLATARGFTDLLQFVFATPDQTDAGSCLYMSLTGIAELLNARLNPTLSRKLDGPGDFSERWLMNVAGDSRYTTGIREWRTDSIYYFNNVGEAVLNRDYRFTTGWFVNSPNGYKKATSQTPNASYGTPFNWIDDRDLIPASAQRVKLPTFERTVMFADPERDQWNVGIMDPKMIDEVKAALLKHKAPVHVLYNHYGYWHALIILGFDDAKDTQGCKFTEGARKHFAGLADKRLSKKLEKSVANHGACNAKGVFYVRDSIYGDASQPEYVYDPDEPTRGKGRYSAPITELEYSFLTHFVNHVVRIDTKL